MTHPRGGSLTVVLRASDGALLGARTRYRQSDAACRFNALADGGFELSFEQSQWSVTPGQSAVLYDGEVCLGGGFIHAAGQQRPTVGAG